MDAYDIKVDLTQMGTVSKEITKITKRLTSDFSDMKSVMQSTAAYWSGEAADLHRQSFQEQIAGIELLLAGFEEQAQKLEQISGNYVSSNQFVGNDVEGLPSDVL